MNLNVMISMICEKGPEAVYRDLMNNDEGFKSFIDNNKNKGANDLIREFNLDFLMEK